MLAHLATDTWRESVTKALKPSVPILTRMPEDKALPNAFLLMLIYSTVCHNCSVVHDNTSLDTAPENSKRPGMPSCLGILSLSSATAGKAQPYR
jgi:hypothetical protein